MMSEFQHIPWWRKDSLGYPIETYKGKPVKSFFRIVIQNLRKLIWGWHDRKYRISFSKFKLPLVTQKFKELNIKNFMSVQPMSAPINLSFYFENMDANNPLVGQIFVLEEKEPLEHCGQPLCCCVRGPSWHKIWTPNGWVFEKDNEVAFKEACDKYNIPYKTECEKNHGNFKIWL
jgi:hypothetical protein